jgi:hypothetical protein
VFVEVELPGPLAHRDHNLHHNEDDDDPLQKRAVLRIKLVVQQLLQVHAYNVHDDIASQRHTCGQEDIAAGRLSEQYVRARA